MQYNFSDRISSLKPSAIREIFKVLLNPEVISFAGGNPAPETFPAQPMAEIAAELFEKNYKSSLQYGITEGLPSLRELTSSRLKSKYSVGGPGDDLIIVTGGQQGIDLTAKVFVNEGDAVICESPSFIGALNAFRSYGANLVPVPVDNDGMDMDALEHALKTVPNVKLIYVIPTFQNPSGVTMSLERRHKLLELADKYDVVILEDNPYIELRYSGQYVPPVKSMDERGRVVYVGSYSKIISPGMRVGFVCAPAEITAKIVVAKQVADVHTNQFFMMLVSGLLERFNLDEHIELSRKIYVEKRDAMLAAMQRSFGNKVSWHVPDGGLFIWANLPEGMDGAALCNLAKDRKVAAVPGSAFLCDQNAVSNGFRLNFSMPSLDAIDRGIKIFGECIKEYVG